MRRRLWRSLAAMAASALVVLVASVAEARAAVLSFAETGAETTAQVVSCTRCDPIARVYDGVVSSSSTHRSADARLGVSAGQEPIVAAMSGTSVASPGQSTSMGSIYDSDVRPPDLTRASGEIDQSANDLPGVVLSSGCCSSATNTATSGAESAVAARDLGRQLASEQQVSETGRALAGGATGTQLRAADRLAREYGGEPGDWAKMGSTSYRGSDGFQFETHWYQNLVNGGRVEFKTKIAP